MASLAQIRVRGIGEAMAGRSAESGDAVTIA